MHHCISVIEFIESIPESCRSCPQVRDLGSEMIDLRVKRDRIIKAATDSEYARHLAILFTQQVESGMLTKDAAKHLLDKEVLKILAKELDLIQAEMARVDSLVRELTASCRGLLRLQGDTPTHHVTTRSCGSPSMPSGERYEKVIVERRDTGDDPLDT